MIRYLRVLYITGTTLNIVGSFLPWQREGDFISYWTLGVRLYPYFKDNGGLLIIVLSTVNLVLLLRPPHFLENPIIWNIVFGIVLVLASGYHIVRFLVQRIAADGDIGAPSPQIGLAVVLVGSLLLLSTTLFDYYLKES